MKLKYRLAYNTDNLLIFLSPKTLIWIFLRKVWAMGDINVDRYPSPIICWTDRNDWWKVGDLQWGSEVHEVQIPWGSDSTACHLHNSDLLAFGGVELMVRAWCRTIYYSSFFSFHFIFIYLFLTFSGASQQPFFFLP